MVQREYFYCGMSSPLLNTNKMTQGQQIYIYAVKSLNWNRGPVLLLRGLKMNTFKRISETLAAAN